MWFVLNVIDSGNYKTIKSLTPIFLNSYIQWQYTSALLDLVEVDTVQYLSTQLKWYCCLCTMRVLHQSDYKYTSTTLRKYTGMENKVEIKTLNFTNTKRQIHQFWKYKYRNLSYLIRKRSCSSWLCPPHPTWASSIAHVAEHWTSGKIHENEIDLYILPPFLA